MRLVTLVNRGEINLTMNQLIRLFLHVLERKDVIDFGERTRIENHLAGRSSDLDFEQVLEAILQLLD
jgi:hypothetical protein